MGYDVGVMLFDLKALSANLEEGQARLIDRLDQIVELLEAILNAGQTDGRTHITDDGQPSEGVLVYESSP